MTAAGDTALLHPQSSAVTASIVTIVQGYIIP